MTHHQSLCVVLLFSTLVLGLTIADTPETYNTHENILYQDGTLAPLTDTPPLVLITGDGELEMLGRYEENAYRYRMMKVAGHDTLIEQGRHHIMTTHTITYMCTV
jgi:hypothetical protein